jgi:hypothetical protein
MLPCLLAATAITAALLPVASSNAVPRNGEGFALADDSYFNFPTDPHGFQTAAAGWYGSTFADLAPSSFRFQILWNADPALIERAKLLADYVRSQGVAQVVVTFKKNGLAPDASTYGASVRNIVGQLASRVDAWGPANEPNRGDTWLPGTGGARLLAAYWAQFNAALDALDPSALRLSPEFVDRRDLGSIAPYVNAYAKAGGGFGHVVGWHPYWGLHATTRDTTDDLLRAVPAELPVWITEVGAFGTNTHGSPVIEDGETVQQVKLNWLVNDPNGLAAHPRVARIYHYHARDTGQPDWDSALLRHDGERRPAWYTWCFASHGNDQAAGDCADWRFLGGLLRGVQGWLRGVGPPDSDSS